MDENVYVVALHDSGFAQRLSGSTRHELQFPKDLLFLRMMTGGAGAKELLLLDETKIDGSKIDLGRFLALLDKAPGNFAIVPAKN